VRSLDGIKMLFVWHETRVGDGTPAGVARVVQEAGCNAVAFKHDDGGRPFSDGASAFGLDPERIRQWRSDIRSRGLYFGLWGYHYGRKLGDEATMAKRAFEFQPDFYIVDWEAEFQNANPSPTDALGMYLATLAYRPGDVGLFHAPLPQPRFWRPWLYKQFNSVSDGMLPQIYHRAMQLPYPEALSRCYDDYARYNLLDRPIYPALQAYDLPAEEVLGAANMAVNVYGARGLSWWSAQHLTVGTSQAIGSVATKEGAMRRVNGLYPGMVLRILPIGTHTVPLRSAFRLFSSDRRVVLDLEFAPVPNTDVPTIIARDGSGAFAGYVDNSGWRRSITVYPDATPEANIQIEVQNGPARVVLFGILEAGG